VKVIAVDIGGAFGNKANTWKDQVVALGSMLTGRPIKWFESQREYIVTGPHQRDVSWQGEVAVKNDGRVLGLKAKLTIDLGVEGSNRGTGTWSIVPACCAVCNAYHWKGIQIDGYGVFTNKSFYCMYRGYGKDKGIKFIESVMNQVARDLDMKPEEVRLKNFIQPDEFPYKQISGYTFDSGDYPATLNKALEMAALKSWRGKQEKYRRQGRHIGIGMAFAVEPAGAAAADFAPGCGSTEARVKMSPDGTVEVYSDRTEIGQGAERSHAIIVAEILGCKIEDVVVLPVTSDWIGTGPVSSRGTVYTASAVAKAAKTLREKVLKYASFFLEEDPENIEIDEGIIYSIKSPEKRLTHKELATRTYFFPGPRGLPKEILLQHDYLLDVTTAWYSPSAAEFGTTYTTFCSSADVAVVEVDIETGITKILNYVHTHDAGRVISEELVGGQIHGGVVQGIGEALSEELVYDEHGQLLSSSYSDYLMPTAVDSPDMIVGYLETPSPFTELGTKGMGEAPIIGSKAAVMAAIEDALSPFKVRVNHAPATREKVRRWILESKRAKE
jgi:carbon-monoxide dehydrogenase large subunit